MILKHSVTAIVISSLLAGCTMAPKYIRPDAPVEQQYPGDTGQPPEKAMPAKDIAWGDFFRDPQLKKLIEVALEQNRDLRIATLRIEEARALYNVQLTNSFPMINAEGSGTRGKTPASLSYSGKTVTSGNYSVGASLSAFEVDLFGYVRSQNDAALSQYLASAEGQRAAHISLVSEVAQTWLRERALSRQIVLAQQSYEAYRKTYQLTQKRYEVGASSALELRQYESLMESARVTLSTLSRDRAQTENALIVLIGGKKIENLPPAGDFSEDSILQEIPAGLPSELLTNRPDIRRDEYKLMASNANIGAARAAFFPRILLTAFGGTASNSLSGLFNAGSSSWSFTPQITLPIFDIARNVFNLDLAHVRKNIAIAEYEKTIQVAFREVADALTARGFLNDQVQAQSAVLNAESERLKLSQARYTNGIASSLEVLDSERQQFAAEQSLVQARLLRMLNTIDLYRSLGGGLIASSETSAPQKNAEQPVTPPQTPAS